MQYQHITTRHGEWLYADIATAGLDQDINSFNRVNPIDVLIEDNVFQCEDQSFDVIFSASVIEHVKYVWSFFDEAKRLLRDGGLFASISPISWPYHDMANLLER